MAAPIAAAGNGWATGASTAPAVMTTKTTGSGFPNPQPSFHPYQNAIYPQQQPAFHPQQPSVYPLAFNSQQHPQRPAGYNPQQPGMDPKERFR
jgi:hypothetical protein